MFGLLKKRIKVDYPINSADWVTNEIGLSLKKYLSDKANIRLTRSINERNDNSILHMPYRHHIFSFIKTNRTKRNILTYYHGEDSDTKEVNAVLTSLDRLSCIVVPNSLTQKHLIRCGVPAQKIVRIPIGIDLTEFQSSLGERATLRKEYGFQDTDVVIGSFQKDGNGWEEGNIPKLIKGPDIFCDVVESLATKYPIKVLLTGPARGYVKNRLNKAGIPYQHKYSKDIREATKNFSALDLYIISSRVEGGPRAIIESMAAGVPLVTTEVGMAVDLVKNKENGMLAEIEDVNGLVQACSRVIEEKELRQSITSNAQLGIEQYDYKVIADMYYELYKKIDEET